jgi:hypothetical protein
MDKRSPHSRRETLFIIAAGVIGALLAALAMTWYLNRDNRWFRLVSPPDETPVQIVALDRKLSPYVRTQQGNIYLCSGHTWRDACRPVQADELPPTELHPQWNTCGKELPPLPVLPGTVVDSVEAGRCFEASTFSKVVILDDGSLWQWRRTFSWVNPFVWVTGVILGLGIGLIAGVFLVKLRRALRDP